MTSKNNNESEFSVVQFIELPFEDIDDYVCVPNTWIIIRIQSDQRAFVAYPKEKNPIDTIDRVKRKEKFSDDWRFYMVTIKYESNSYYDAQYWISKTNKYGPLNQVGLKETDSSITYDHRPTTSQTNDNNMRISSIRQNSTHFPNLTYQRQLQPIQQNSQQQPQRSNKRTNGKKVPSLQGVAKKTPKTYSKTNKEKRKLIHKTNVLNPLRQTPFLSNNPQLQNSTITKPSDTSKFLLKQQILDNSAALITQMGSNLRYTIDMYNKLRSLILDAATTYKKILGVAEQLNITKNAASNASLSSNLRPKNLPTPKERHTKVTASASSSNQDQHSNDVANKIPN